MLLVSSTTIKVNTCTSYNLGCVGGNTDDRTSKAMPPAIYSASFSISNPLPPFSINAWTHNSLRAGHWAHAMNTWSCMSHRSGIAYTHMHNANLSLGDYSDCTFSLVSATSTNIVWIKGENWWLISHATPLDYCGRIVCKPATLQAPPSFLMHIMLKPQGL